MASNTIGRINQLKRKDTIGVIVDGEEKEVYNWVTLQRHTRVRATQYQTVGSGIFAGDGGVGKPEAITHWLADMLFEEHGIDVDQRDIEVVDPTDDGVTIL